MSRISNTFSLLKSKDKKALIPFVTAGDPSAEMTKKILHQLVDSGADISGTVMRKPPANDVGA